MKKTSLLYHLFLGMVPDGNTETATRYNRKLFDADKNPIYPILMFSTFIDDGIPQEYKEKQNIDLITSDSPTSS